VKNNKFLLTLPFIKPNQFEYIDTI
jgi:hypothetical protein